MSASTIVLSCGSALPRAWTPATAAESAAAQSAASITPLPAVAVPSCRNSVPYSGPPAPPTVDTSVMPTALNSAPTSPGACPSSLASAACMPRFMLIPWSASPIAESSCVR